MRVIEEHLARLIVSDELDRLLVLTFSIIDSYFVDVRQGSAN